jgi:hypothetical protein
VPRPGLATLGGRDALAPKSFPFVGGQHRFRVWWLCGMPGSLVDAVRF